MRVYAPDLKHRAHPPWTHQIQQLHHPVPSTSRSPIPFWHPHLQFDVPAFFGRMFCIKFLLRSTDTEIQSYPSVTRDFQSIAFLPLQPLIFIDLLRRASLFRIASLHSAPSVSSSLWVYYGTGMWLFFCRGHDQTWTWPVSHGRKKKSEKKSRGRVTSLSDHACIIVTVSRVLFFIILPPKRFISFDQYKMTKTEKLGSF